MFEYYEMNCTLEENYEFIKAYSNFTREYLPMIGFFPLGEKNSSESNEGYFLNLHEPDNIFHDLAVLMSNHTEIVGANNVKEFMESLFFHFEFILIRSLTIKKEALFITISKFNLFK